MPNSPQAGNRPVAQHRSLGFAIPPAIRVVLVRILGAGTPNLAHVNHGLLVTMSRVNGLEGFVQQFGVVNHGKTHDLRRNPRDSPLSSGLGSFDRAELLHADRIEVSDL